VSVVVNVVADADDPAAPCIDSVSVHEHDDDHDRSRNVTGLSARNLRNCRQIALAWPRLVIHQTLSVESVPRLPAPAGDALPWRDDGWMTRLRTELSLSHLLQLSRIDNPVAPCPARTPDRDRAVRREGRRRVMRNVEQRALHL
jgi:hypothetical protein